jgi:hypothetical protein
VVTLSMSGSLSTARSSPRTGSSSQSIRQSWRCSQHLKRWHKCFAINVKWTKNDIWGTSLFVIVSMYSIYLFDTSWSQSNDSQRCSRLECFFQFRRKCFQNLQDYSRCCNFFTALAL